MKNSILMLLLATLCLYSCKSEEGKQTPEITSVEDTFTFDEVTPVDFPKLDIPGFHFPEDSTVINSWIYNDDMDTIYAHGWGIWTGLTTPTPQSFDGQQMLVYETWLTPNEMIKSILGQPINRSNRANLKMPKQFTHFQATPINDKISESVSYSPAAANHAIKNKLFLATTLYDYAQAGRKGIPDFPNDAITIKPVFKLLAKSNGNPQSIETWHGTIDSLSAFGESQWHSCVYVDTTNQSNGTGEQLMFPDSPNPPAPTASTTYNINDFIHYKLNAEDAYYFNKEFSQNAQAGDYAILVGMHVTTKENKRWTWETFWWAPNADNPPAPSSKAIADQRPLKYMTSAAAHYAMAPAYYMVNPQEPYSGENVTGTPNYAFNPYLEAGFGPNVFDKSISYVDVAGGDKVDTYVGVRTNCMSCHAMATVDPQKLDSSSTSNTPYVGNSYVSLSDPIFKGQLTLDFAWSIQGNIDTTGFKAHVGK